MARTRRTAEEARAQIVAVARAQVARSGPAALRLQEVARAAGVSHPTILHHFGSREGLVQAVVSDTIQSLRDELQAELGRQRSLDPVPLVRALARVLHEGGLARLIAWLSLADHERSVGLVDTSSLITAVHDARRTMVKDDEVEPKVEESIFVALLTVSAIMGEAIMGDMMRRDFGKAETVNREAFHERLGEVVRGLVDTQLDRAE